MTSIVTWISAHALWYHWVIVALIPQIIVAVSSAPKGSSFADALKVFLQILSVFDHHDVGFVKLPLMTSAMSRRIFTKKETPTVPPAVPPAAPTAVLLIFFMLSSSMSCSWFNTPTNTPGTPGIISCTEKKVADEALSILGKVATALASAGYEAALVTLAATLPADIAQAAIACAVQQNVSHAHAASMKAPGDNTAAIIETNGTAWLTAHNPQFAK